VISLRDARGLAFVAYVVIATPKVNVLFIDCFITTPTIPYYVLYYDKLKSFVFLVLACLKCL
jgi:hypothetical protein